jgi:hypothetical protein
MTALQEMVGRKILEVRPLNVAELRYENARDGVLISLTRDQCIVICTREDGETVARWQDMGGAVSIPHCVEENY